MARIRSQRVAAALKEEMARILEHDLKDPGLNSFITVTGAEITPDLKQAKIYVSVLGKKASTAREEKILSALTRAKGFIKRLLGERLKLRYTPELFFAIDKSLAKQMRIVEILEKIERERDNDEGDT